MNTQKSAYCSAAGAGGSGGGAGAAGAVSLSRVGSDAFREAGGAGGSAGADSYLRCFLETGAADELDSSLLWEDRRLLEDDCLGVELLESVELESERLELERLEPLSLELELLELVSST